MATADDDVTTAVRLEPQSYPWQQANWATLTRDLARLPHALLLHGQAGLGKNAFAQRLARWLLCQDRRGADACETCRGCLLFRVGNHPDLLLIEPEEEGKGILVDPVRGVVDFLSLTPHLAAYKIVIITPAEAMNINAANSLLKILEEPPAGSLLILVASHLARVAVTIRSRCTRVGFSAPASSEALSWLRAQAVTPPVAQAALTFAGGAPLAALASASSGAIADGDKLLTDLTTLARRAGDPVVCAERWKKLGTAASLIWLQRFLIEQLRSQVSASDQVRIELSMPTSGKTLSIMIIDLFNFIDMVSIAIRQLGTGIDETLMLEELLIRWSEIILPAS